jgi:hypothetical protein
MIDYKHMHYSNRPSNRPKDSIGELIMGCVCIYAIGITLFVAGLRAAGVV